MPTLNRGLYDISVVGPVGPIGVQGMRESEMKEIKRKQLLKERKLKIENIYDMNNNNLTTNCDKNQYDLLLELSKKIKKELETKLLNMNRKEKIIKINNNEKNS